MLSQDTARDLVAKLDKVVPISAVTAPYTQPFDRLSIWLRP
jgi:hypothetical protein